MEIEPTPPTRTIDKIRNKQARISLHHRSHSLVGPPVECETFTSTNSRRIRNLTKAISRLRWGSH